MGNLFCILHFYLVKFIKCLNLSHSTLSLSLSGFSPLYLSLSAVRREDSGVTVPKKFYQSSRTIGLSVILQIVTPRAQM